MEKYNLSKGRAYCYKIKRKEAFSIIDKEPEITIKKLATKMGVNYGYAGNGFIAYRRHNRVSKKNADDNCESEIFIDI